LVAKRLGWSGNQQVTDQGWLTNTLEIPEIWYEDILRNLSEMTASRIYDLLLREDTDGIIKVVGLSDPVAEDEKAYKNAIGTKILKKLFGEIFKHPRRQPDTTSISRLISRKMYEKGRPFQITTQAKSCSHTLIFHFMNLKAEFRDWIAWRARASTPSFHALQSC
jgi:hypothetical protein